MLPVTAKNTLSTNGEQVRDYHPKFEDGKATTGTLRVARKTKQNKTLAATRDAETYSTIVHPPHYPNWPGPT